MSEPISLVQTPKDREIDRERYIDRQRERERERNDLSVEREKQSDGQKKCWFRKNSGLLHLKTMRFVPELRKVRVLASLKIILWEQTYENCRAHSRPSTVMMDRS